MSKDTETSNESDDIPELTDELSKIVESGYGHNNGDPEPEDFQDISDDAIDWVDDDDEINESDDEESSSDDTAESGQDDKAADPLVESLAKRGVTQEHIERARELGLSDEDIKAAGSKKALRAIENVLSRQLHEAGKKAQAKPDQLETAEEKAVKTEAAADKGAEGSPEPKKVKSGDMHRFDLEAMEKDDYDEALWKSFESHNKVVDEIDSLRSEIASLKTAGQNPVAEQTSYVDAFDMAADDILPEFFGKRFDGKKDTPLEKQFIERRAKLSDTFQELAEGYRVQGRELPSPERLLKQAAGLAFGSELEKAQAKAGQAERQQRIKKQAARRRPAGSSAGTIRQIHAEPGSADALASDPDIQRFYAQAIE